MVLDSKNEFQKKAKVFLIMIILPIVFTMVFGFMYKNVYVEEIKTGILDLDKNESSRTIVEAIDESKGLRIYNDVENQKELESLLMDGRIGCGIIIPDNFSADMKKGKSPSILVLIDGTNIVIGNNVMAYTSTIFNTLGASVSLSYLEGGGIVKTESTDLLTTLTFTDRVLYDPTLSYFMYMFPIFLSIFAQQTYLMVVTPMLIEEKNNGLLGNRIWNKIINYVALAILSSAICLLIANTMFGFPLRGNIGLMFILEFIFLFDLTAVSFILAALFKEVVHCVQFAMFLSLPTTLTCGHAWAEFVMPEFFTMIIKAFWPLIYFINPVREIQMKGVGIEAVSGYLISGIVFGMFWMIVGTYLYRRNKNQILRMCEK